jgi:hypothetical protein
VTGAAPDPAALTDLIASVRALADSIATCDYSTSGCREVDVEPDATALREAADALEVLVARNPLDSQFDVRDELIWLAGDLRFKDPNTSIRHEIPARALVEVDRLRARCAELEARTTPPDDAAEVMALFGYTLPEFVYLLRRHARGAGLLAADLIENAYLGVTTEGEPA